jgi:hypothetical protein
MNSQRTKVALRVMALAGLALSVAGCDSIRTAAGLNKTPPDEFAVVTKAPLVIPPDYALRPPLPGAAPTNQSSPTGAAEAALYGDDPDAIANSLGNSYSPEEKALLATSGAATADPAIRQQLASDEKAMEGSDPSFTDKILFSAPNPDAGHPVDADAEKQRLDAAKAAGQVTPGPGPQPSDTQQASSDTQTPAAKPDGTSATISKGGSNNSGGWLGGIF